MVNKAGHAERSWARRRATREFLLAVGRRLLRWRILRVRNGHYYSPVPSIKELKRDAPRIFDRSLRTLPGVELHEAEQLALLPQFATFYAEQPFSDTPQADMRYFFACEYHRNRKLRDILISLILLCVKTYHKSSI